MAIMARSRVPAAEFALAETLSTQTDVECEVERIVASGEDTVMPLLWVRGIDPDTAAAAFEDDPSVREESLLLAFEEEAEQLYRMEWVAAIELVLQILTTEEATITMAVGKGESWYLRALYPTRDALTETIEYQYLAKHFQPVVDLA